MLRSSRLTVLFVVALAGCDPIEVLETSYPDLAEAESRGGVSSGWIPKWLPTSSTNLREIHDIDTNESALAFDISGDTGWRPPSQCNAVPVSAVTPSRFDPEWWPDSDEFANSYEFYSCPTDVPPTSVYVGVHNAGDRGIHWRVSAG